MPDYAKVLNEAQFEAVTAEEDAVLVVAGAGSGKTRAIVHRLAWLVEQGVAPQSILLLTFTRKAAQEMLDRSSLLLDTALHGVQGGTFHSFAYATLRQFPPQWLNGRSFTLMDSGDMTQAMKQCRDHLKIGKRDTSFPKNQTIVDILSKARNKELSIAETLRRDSFHLLPHAEALEELGKAYRQFKRDNALLDYDDLLFELEELLKSGGTAAAMIRDRYAYVLVDEYQDTNLVQARIVRQLAMPAGPGKRCAKVMAVGDEAQSIYGFRGANVRNILDFPKIFPNSRIIKLEENYRSDQPVLDVANSILQHAPESYKKNLFTTRTGGEKARLVTPLSDMSQAALVAQRIQELLEDHMPGEIAVLFRSGYHSYPLENELRRAGIAFRKYGGLRFTEAAHIKDVLAWARLIINPLDFPSFSRTAAMHKGIGPKTAMRLHELMKNNDKPGLQKACARFPEFMADLEFIDKMRQEDLAPALFFDRLLDYYRPRMEELYPEDWPRRQQGLEEVLQMASKYEALDYFLADLALETPEMEEQAEEDCVTLSTIHSAKGLEWDAVLIIDLVEDRFPSRHAISRSEDYEEERRLFYVACTRARHILELYAPASLFSRAEQSSVSVSQSPLVHELSRDCLDIYRENYGILKSALVGHKDASGSIRPMPAEDREPLVKKARKSEAGQLSYCQHRIFGRGKIVRILDDEKVQVNFPGFGLKVILKEYLRLEE